MRMNSGPGWSAFASRGIGNTAMPVSESYAVAPTCWSPKRRSIENGSTPERASLTRATMVGRPAESRLVISEMLGGLTSPQDRSRYGRASERPVKKSRPESTET